MSDELGKIVVSLILDGADSFDRDAKKAAQSLGSISIKLDQYERATKSAGDGTRSFLSKMRDYTIVFGGVHNAIQMATDAITAIPKSIITANAQLEKNRVLLAGLQTQATSFAQAQSMANDELQKLLSVSSAAPFSLDAILGSYTKLRVGGIENTTEAMQGLLDTASKSGASSEQLKLASVAIQQMAGKGVISMEELRGQLGEAVPQAMNIMSRAVGMDMAKMVKIISTGSMESKSALALFFREMKLENDGAAAMMANTWDGTIEQIKKSWGMLTTDNGNGTEFFSKMKEQARELNSYLKTNDAKQYMRQIDQALSSFVSGAVSATKVLIDNFGLVSAALVGIFSAGKISSAIAGIGKIRTSWAEASAAITAKNAEIGQAANAQVTPLIARQNQLKAAIEDVTNQSAKASRMYQQSMVNGNQSTEVMRQAHLDLYNAEIKRNNALIAGHTLEMKLNEARIASINSASQHTQQINLMSGALGQARNAANAVANAFGGWGNIAITVIASVIGYVTQAILKQRELNKTLLETKGINANAEQAEYAKERLKDLDEQKKKVDQLQASLSVAKQSSKSMYGTSADDAATASMSRQLDIEKEKLRVLQSEHAQWEKIAKTSASAQDAQYKSQGEEMLTGAGSEYLTKITSIESEIARKKDDALEQLKSVKDQSKAAAEWQTKRGEIERDALQKQIDVYQGAQVDLEKQRQELMSQLDPSGRGINMDSLTTEQRSKLVKLNSAVDLSIKKQRELRESMLAPVGDVKILNQTTPKAAKKDAGQSMDDSLDIQIAKLREKYTALQNNRDIETKSAEIEARIANGDYKGKSAEFIATLRAKAAEYDKLNNNIKDFSANQKEAEKASDALQNQINSLQKKAGKSDIDANNPYLQWARGTEGEKEALSQRIEQLKELGAYNDKEAEKARQASELIARIDQNSAHDMITEKDKELTRALMTTRQAAAAQHQEELVQLEAMRQQVLKMDESPARQQMLRDIDQVKAKMEAVYQRENDPFIKWMHSADQMADNLSTKVMDSFDGVFDAIATRIVDTTTSFNQMVRSLADELQKYIIKMLMIQAIKAGIEGMGFSMPSFGGSASSGGSSAFSSSAGASSSGYSSMPSFDISAGYKGYANGGIMTPYGDLPLKKYANGGVATSPQVAIFGEASMNEAYVPLPDGRSIPVTMSGANAAPAVTVNVINQSGTPVDAESSSPRFDGESYVIDVVLNALSRPGRLRTAVKGAK